MNAPSPGDQQKQQVRGLFNTISPQYDAIRFVHLCAERLIALSPLLERAQVLDVATGTGLVAMVVAQIIGPGGRVVGIDFSPDMLAQARQKLAQTDNTNVEFQEGDAEHLPFPDNSFDVVLCASSLFFVPNILAALKEAYRVLKPDGIMGFSSFGDNFLTPLLPLWGQRLARHGIPAAPRPIDRLVDPAVCATLMEKAGFHRVEVRSEALGYYLATPQDRIREIEVSLEGLPLARLSLEEQAQIKAEHLAELEPLMTDKGIWADVPANFAFGWKR